MNGRINYQINQLYQPKLFLLLYVYFNTGLRFNNNYTVYLMHEKDKKTMKFLALNGITPCLAPTKEEGLKIENNTSERLASSFHTDGPVWTAARGRRGRGGWRGGWRGGRGAGGRGGRGRGEARGRGFYCNGT